MTLSTALLVCALASNPAPEGWENLFDGETLNGWTTTGGRYDGPAIWSVVDGTIHGKENEQGQGGLIYTEREYRNVEFECEAFISHPFDSGVFVRMRPRPEPRGAQLTLDYRDGGEIGGIYSDGWMFHNPDAKAKWNKDEWNHVRVRCVGQPMHLMLWLNGELVTDYRMPEGAGKFSESGKVGLQVHGGGVEGGYAQFKNIRARELPDGAGQYWTEDPEGQRRLTAAGEAAGWRALFNGKDLTGWHAEGNGKGYAVRDGEMVFLVEGGSPHLITEQDYQDFQLRLDFKISKMANSGLFLRASRDGANPAFSGCELQILDDFNWETETNSKLAPYQFTGGLYGSVAPGKQALKPLGEWNTYEITYNGTRIITVLNGQVLYDIDTKDVKPEQGAHFTDRVPTGFIGLQRHAPGGAIEGDAYAWFRN
ncbi:MAG: DUF1080 domain-containing protein, partial [Planctomycetota bacterium]|nr:DUF1080 domain-containing protein [Planctomycetota bacterium]